MMFMTPYTRRHTDMGSFNPFRDLAELERSFFGEDSLAAFRTDIQDTGDAYVLEADLPGFQKDDINIDVGDDYVTISAERHSDFEDKDKQGNYVRCERSYGAYSRSFSTAGIDMDNMKASFDNGVLRLTMPKQQAKPVGGRKLLIE